MNCDISGIRNELQKALKWKHALQNRDAVTRPEELQWREQRAKPSPRKSEGMLGRSEHATVMPWETEDFRFNSDEVWRRGLI